MTLMRLRKSVCSARFQRAFKIVVLEYCQMLFGFYPNDHMVFLLWFLHMMNNGG